MDAHEKQQEKKQAALLADLRSTDTKKVMSALKNTADDGTGDFIVPLLELYRDTPSEEIRERVSELLSSLKVSEAEDIFIDALEDERFIEQRGAILSFMWNSGFQAAEAIDTITRCALEGDYMTAIEAMTLLDSLTQEPEEESLYQALIEIRAFLEKHKDSGHEVYDVALSIFQQLAQYERDRPLP
jgi:hypothetical protein